MRNVAIVFTFLLLLRQSRPSTTAVTTRSTPPPTIPPSQAPASASCPLDFAFMRNLPWDAACCTSSSANVSGGCCSDDLLRILGIALALRLRHTSNFGLPDTATFATCLGSLQTILASSFAIPSSVVHDLFPSITSFVLAGACAGISMVDGLRRKLPDTSALDGSCKRISASSDVCNPCMAAMTEITQRLLKLDKRSRMKECYILTMVYTAGLLAAPGPTGNDTVGCIFGLPLHISSPAMVERRSRSILLWGLIAGAVAAVSATLALCFYLARRRRARREEESLMPSMGAAQYTVDELRRATGNFSESSIIGRGGFAVVYRGVLADGSVVAVKKIMPSHRHRDGDGDDDEEKEFLNEVGILSNLKHQNLVSLRGCCIGGGGGRRQRYLVCDYMANGSLHGHLSDPERRRALAWRRRRAIVLDVARGLAYLHHGVRPAIIHRDVKPNNILLDENMRAAVADFGLARRRDPGSGSYLTDRIAGTRGYLAPEYVLYGQLSSKVDVYSFGVMVLEMISGRRAFDPTSTSSLGEEPVVVAQWAMQLMRTGRAADVVEVTLLDGADGGEVAEMERFVKVGGLCAHVKAGMRPSMADALKMLEGDKCVITNIR